MMCHPARWLWGLILIAMLGWLAVQTELEGIQADLGRRSRIALDAAGHDWVSVAFDGRDGLLAGLGGSERQRNEAVALVGQVWGVRAVRTRWSDEPEILVAPAPLDLKQPEDIPRLDDVAPARGRSLITDMPIASAQELGPPMTALGGVDPDALAAPAPLDALVSASEAYGGLQVLAPLTPVRAHVAEMGSGARLVTDMPVVTAREAGDGGTEAPEPTVATIDEPAHVDEGLQHAGAGAASANAEGGGVVPPPMPPVDVAPDITAKIEADHVRIGDGPAPSTGTIPPSPERKAVVAGPAAVQPVAPLQSLPAPQEHTAPPPTVRVPRFETAALPPGNMAEHEVCGAAAEQAASRAQVHFARGDAGLDGEGKALLDELAVALAACPGLTLRIAGHADASGKARNNRVLSTLRARSVAAYLIEKGIDEGRLVAVGYGDQRPVAPNDSRENRAKNRRIELSITASGSQLPSVPVRKQGTPNGLSRR